jgi:Replication-relaxation
LRAYGCRACADAENRCTTWIKDAIAGDQKSGWTKICASLTKLYEAKIAAGKPAEPTIHIVDLIRAFLALEGNITARQIARIYANLDDTTVGAVLSATPNDYIVMTYVDEGRDIAFPQASPGQQASALLELLLRQSAAALVGRSLDRTNDRLLRLFHAGYIDRPRAQLDRFPSAGSSHFVYALADRGARLLIECDGIEFANVEWSRKNRLAGRPFIEHQLEIMDFYVSLECAARARADELRRADPLMHVWQDSNGREVQLM